MGGLPTSPVYMLQLQVLVTDGHRLRRITLSYFDPSTIQDVESFNRVVTLAGSLDTGSADGIGQDARFNDLKVFAAQMSFLWICFGLYTYIDKIPASESFGLLALFAIDARGSFRQFFCTCTCSVQCGNSLTLSGLACIF